MQILAKVLVFSLFFLMGVAAVKMVAPTPVSSSFRADF
jgi:hypothetical protein